MINFHVDNHHVSRKAISDHTAGLILLGVISMSLIFSLLAFLFAIISICR